MKFVNPFWLLLLPILWGVLWWSGKLLLGMTPTRKRFVIALRGIVVTLLVFALAGIQAVQVHRRVCTIFVLDASESVSEPARQKARDFISQAIRHARYDDLTGVILFGRNPMVEIPPTQLRSLPNFTAAPDKSATDIAAALRLAMGLFPDGYSRRIVLLSDGNETHGDTIGVASVARTEGITIDVVPLKTAEKKQEVIVTDVLMPSEAKVGQPFPVRIIAEATVASSGVLRIDRDGIPVKEVAVNLSPGKNSITTSLRVDNPGISRFRFVLEVAPDTDPRNNIGMGLVSVKGKPKVLLAEGQPDPTGALVKALRANDLEVVRVGEGGLPTRPEEWQQFDAIIFSDYPAWAMSEQQMRVVRSAVRDTGIGFLMIGGEQSFLPGGYYGTPIAEVLPVDLDVRQRKVYPAATIVIIMDTSGSMGVMEGGVQKAHLAAKAAIETLKMLRPIDRFGVIVSGTGTDWLAPIQPAKEAPKIIEQISRIYAGGGGIYCRPSLELAAKAIVAEATRVRHIIMLADTDDCDEQEGCFEIAAQLRRLGVTLTVVGIGRPDGIHAPFCQQLAKIGGGNYYVARSARDLPKLFTADVSVMTRSAIEEGAFIPKIVGGDEMLAGVDWRKTPPLLAYCLTSDKPLARTLMRTDKDDPLLATWQFGLGTSTAFTSDAKPKWARQWVQWSDFATFWANVVRSALRKATQTRYAITTQVRQGEAIIELEAFTPEGEPINLLQPKVNVSTPSGESRSLVLQQEGLGRYRGRVPVNETGVYLVTVHEQDETGKTRVSTTGFALPYPTEYRFTRTNLPLLERIAELTAGKVNPEPNEVYRLPPKPSSSVTDIWHFCVALALALFLMDIAARRLALGVPEVVAALVRRFAEIWQSLTVRRPVPAAETGSRLLSVKQRVRQRTTVATTVNPTKPSGTSEPSSKPEPTKQIPSSGQVVQTTSRLLEVKRKRRTS
ncbi:MAG: VWA domain-containing protein [Armatimonadota bacterium]